MNKASSLASGGVVIAIAVAFKLFAKTAIFASLFGGVAVVNNMYESSVIKVRNEVKEFNKKNPKEPIYMNEEGRELIFNDVVSDVADNDLKNVSQNALNDVRGSLKKETLDFIEKNKDTVSNYFLIKHGWTETHKVKTQNDKLIVSYTINGAELN